MTASVRDEATVSGELDSLRRLNADAHAQLARTRATMEIKKQEIGVLELHEYNLLVAIDGRCGKIDRLLDEMLVVTADKRAARAAAAAELQRQLGTGI